MEPGGEEGIWRGKGYLMRSYDCIMCSGELVKSANDYKIGFVYWLTDSVVGLWRGLWITNI